jgi:hypothetical protein
MILDITINDMAISYFSRGGEIFSLKKYYWRRRQRYDIGYHDQ